MKEKDLPIDRSRHAIYTKKAKQCVQKLLHRYYDEKTASAKEFAAQALSFLTVKNTKIPGLIHVRPFI